MLIPRLVFAASSGWRKVGISEAHRQSNLTIRERRRAPERILNRRHDIVLVLPKAKHVTVLVEDYKEYDAATFGLHLTHERTGATIGARERSRLGNDASARDVGGKSIFQCARIDPGDRQNIRERKLVLGQLFAQPAQNLHHGAWRDAVRAQPAG